MAKYRVNWNLDMGPDKYHAEDQIELSDEQAAELVPCGVVTLLEGDPVTADVATVSPQDLAKLSKGKLAEYAQAKFGKTLDVSAMTKDALLAEIATMTAEAEK